MVGTFATNNLKDQGQSLESASQFGFTFYSATGWGLLAQSQSTMDKVKDASR